MMPSREKSSAISLTVFASLLWGTSFPGVKVVIEHAGNDVLVLFLRFVVAAAVTLPIVLYLKRFSPRLLREPMIWVLGGLNAWSFVAQYVGLNFTTASKTALLVDINVVAVAVISFFVFKERLRMLQLLGIASGIGGVVLLTTEGGIGFNNEQFLGDLLVFTAGCGWAFFIVLNKKLLDRHTGIELSTGTIATTCVWLLPPLGYLWLTGIDYSIDAVGWMAVVHLGIFCTSLALLFWAMGLEGVSATVSATLMLIEVVTALAISIVLLGETLAASAVVGAVLIMAALYLVSSDGGKKEAAMHMH